MIGKLVFGDAVLSFSKLEGGEKILLLFHGFGQDHTAFDSWHQELKAHYTIYSFDIFYHGLSHRSNTFLLPEEWRDIFQAFLRQESIKRFSIIGYSLGGRFTIVTSFYFSDKIDQTILIAPDAIYQNFWYGLANTALGNKIFKSLMNEESAVFPGFVSFLDAITLKKFPIVRFAKKVLSLPGNRNRVYHTWTFFRTLKIEKKRVLEHLNDLSNNWLIVLGSRDKIIQENLIKHYFHSTSKVDFSTLDVGHNHLIEKFESDIKSELISAESEG